MAMSDTTRSFTSLELGLAKSRSDCVNGDGSAIPLYSSVDVPPRGLPPLSVLLDEYGLSPRTHDEEHVMTVLRDALDKNEIGTEACQRNPLESFLEAEARAELIFIFAADAFDVAEFYTSSTSTLWYARAARVRARPQPSP